MNFKIEKCIRDNTGHRQSFIDLAVKTFNLSFEGWYQGGYWADKYIPYTILDGEKVVANASVNIIDTVWKGQPKRYIQLGTVMTDIAYRGKGLSRRLIEEILMDMQDKCDAVYLYANDTVLDFYPKLGFTKATEYRFSMPVSPNAASFKRLDMWCAKDIAFLKGYYAKSNPFSALPMLDNYGLLMFYCSSFMRDCVLYCQEFDAVVIAEQENGNLLCHDIYCDPDKSLHDIISAVAPRGTNTVTFGFTPSETFACTATAAVDVDETLFVLDGKENIFAQNKVRLPSLSHA